MAESLALNNVQLMSPGSKASVKPSMAKRGFLPPVIGHDDASLFNEKRNKIAHPARAKHESKKRNKINSNKQKLSSEKKSDSDVSANVNSQKVNSSTDASAKKSEKPDSPSSTTSSTEEKTEFVEPAIAKDFVSKYSVQPRADMKVKCKVPGKESALKGTLKYLGRISNLPKRSNVVVAGIQLEHEEDLGTDGTFLGKRYFTTPNKRGYFVPMKNCTPM